jgi:hypothetical protein
VGERLIRRVTPKGRERRKALSATLASVIGGTELVKTTAITIAMEMRNLQQRGLD